MGYAKCPTCGNVFDVPGFHVCPGDRPPPFIRIREIGGVEHYFNLDGIKGAALIKCEGLAEAFLDVTWASGRTDRLVLERVEAERAYARIIGRGA